MKTYQVALAKSYLVTVRAATKERAREIAEFYTSDIQDISTDQDRKKDKFSIEEIECAMNESLDAEEIEKS